MRRSTGLATAALALALAAPAGAQQQATYEPLAVGDVAPDFELPGATRHGILQQPVRLSDYKGETVVLAFFFRERTRG